MIGRNARKASIWGKGWKKLSTWLLVFAVRGSLSLFTYMKTKVQRSRHLYQEMTECSCKV